MLKILYLLIIITSITYIPPFFNLDVNIFCLLGGLNKLYNGVSMQRMFLHLLKIKLHFSQPEEDLNC